MILITGLLGMMAVGSLAFLSFNDEPEDEIEPENDGAQPSTDAVGAEPGSDVLSADASAVPNPVSIPIEMTQGFLDVPAGEDPDLPEDVAREQPGAGQHDWIRGGKTAEQMSGPGGDDTLSGGAGDDDLYGEGGDDSLSGGSGDDTLLGGSGADWMHGNAGHDALHGREDADTLIGGRGHDTLFGGDGNDLLDGLDQGPDGDDLDGRDHLNGGNGDDLVIAGEADVVSLGTGADVLVLGDWMTDQGAQLLDFDEDEDQLLVVYNDAAQGEVPEVGLRMNAGNPSLTEIVLGDEVLATLSTEDAPDLSSIVLIGESTLAGLDFEGLAARQAG